MIIDRQITPFVVFTDDELNLALQKIGNNKSGIVFAVTQSGIIEGVLTDGDLRRWLLLTKELDLTRPVSEALNSQFVWAKDDETPDAIEKLFSERIEYVPLVDKQQRLVAVASHKTKQLQFDSFILNEESPSFIIAEIGNNHNGSLELAYQLVNEAVLAGADCAKFQMRDMGSMYRNNASAHGEDLGAEYTLDLLNRFQLSIEDMFKVFDYCKLKGIIPLCTPWDLQSLYQLEKYGMCAYKVASADLTNHELLEALAKTSKPLICSTGMSTEAEIKESIALLRRFGAGFVLLHCNSTYPAPFKDVNLHYMARLKEISKGGYVGYSGHERGIAVALAAVSMGAKVIEKHFTLDRSMEGNDHRVSLLPAEFAQMVQGIREIEAALGSAETRKVSQGEMMNREILGKSLISTRAIKLGESIQDADIECRSPGKGLAPYKRSELIGKTALRDIEAGDFFYDSDLKAEIIQPRPYHFNRPFGIPLRYHDFAAMVNKSNFDLIEFHFSYKDLELEPLKFLSSDGYDLDFVVHSPELFSGDHIMDLCAEDPVYRQRSIDELQKVINVTRGLKPLFRLSKRPCIIVNAGGFTLNGFMPKEQRAYNYRRIADALAELDSEGVEIIPQTMPPYPWHFGGQRFHNLFMDSDEIVAFCRQYKMRVCLDVSHSKLACTLEKRSFSEFIKQVAPWTAHLHIVDAIGVDGEGLQIDEGEIDFANLASELNQLAAGVSFIPEIWQGHKNDGEGFWLALERLEKFGF